MDLWGINRNHNCKTGRTTHSWTHWYRNGNRVLNWKCDWSIKGCSHGAIATVIYLSQLMHCMGFKARSHGTIFLFATAFLFNERKWIVCCMLVIVFTWCNPLCVPYSFVCNIASKWVSHPFCAITMCDSECDSRHIPYSDIKKKCKCKQKESHHVNKITKSHAGFHFLI